jgi:hypothetical protein
LPAELHEYLQTTAGVSLTDAAKLLTDYLEFTRFIASLDGVADETDVMKQIIARYEQLEKQFAPPSTRWRPRRGSPSGRATRNGATT